MSLTTERPRETVAPAREVRPKSRRSRAHWAFVGPAVALLAIFFAYPLVASFIQSFQRLEGGQYVWAGLDQYRRLIHDPLVLKAFINTALILVIQVPIMVLMALGLAQILNRSWLKFRATFRIVHFLPAVTTLVAYAIVFRVLLKTDGGMMNQLLTFLHLPPVDWLNSPLGARIALIGSLAWRWTGYNMVILLAGLQAIPREQYDAAAVDGAGPVTSFVRVIVPQLKPVILFVTVTSTIGTLQLFDEPFILTGGGPANATLTPIIYLYRVGFQQLDFAYASAIAWVLVLFIGILSFLQFRFLGRERT